MQQRRTRTKYLVDGKVQGALLLRAVRYWLLSLATVGVLTVVGWFLITPGLLALLDQGGNWKPLATVIGIGLGVSLLVLPVVLVDFVRLTHRFVGPIFRLRNSMQKLAAGEEVAPIKFRKNDFWHDLADVFNELLKQRNAMRANLALNPQADGEASPSVVREETLV